jgi:hypothetical protein
MVALTLSSAQNEPEETGPESGSLDLFLLDIYQLLDLFVTLLSGQALRYLGLQVDPSAKETKKDLVKAHIAIDCVIALVDKMEPQLTAEDKDRFRNLITSLQINYAQQMK